MKPKTTPDTDILAALDGKTPRGPQVRFTPEVAKARKTEITKRNNRAQQHALQALRRLHPEEYKILYTEARRRVYETAGPLPGDGDA